MYDGPTIVYKDASLVSIVSIRANDNNWQKDNLQSNSLNCNHTDSVCKHVEHNDIIIFIAHFDSFAYITQHDETPKDWPQEQRQKLTTAKSLLSLASKYTTLSRRKVNKTRTKWRGTMKRITLVWPINSTGRIEHFQKPLKLLNTSTAENLPHRYRTRNTYTHAHKCHSRTVNVVGWKTENTYRIGSSGCLCKHPGASSFLLAKETSTHLGLLLLLLLLARKQASADLLPNHACLTR